ncbi:hypothetical protein [Hyella patelloides]|nr:hypothetical protein [Hyella patelloides]
MLPKADRNRACGADSSWSEGEIAFGGDLSDCTFSSLAFLS